MGTRVFSIGRYKRPSEHEKRERKRALNKKQKYLKNYGRVNKYATCEVSAGGAARVPTTERIKNELIKKIIINTRKNLRRIAKLVSDSFTPDGDNNFSLVRFFTAGKYYISGSGISRTRTRPLCNV